MYIFAANIDHPNLMEIFQKAVGEEFTNAGLEKEFKKGGSRRRRREKTTLLAVPAQRPVGGKRIEEQVDAFKKSHLEALLNDLWELVTLVEGRLPDALDNSGPAA